MLVLFLTSNALAEEREFKINQGKELWLVLMEGNGTVHKKNDSAQVTIRNLRIENHSRSQEIVQLKAIKVTLSALGDHLDWTHVSEAPTIQIDPTLSTLYHGESLNYRNLELDIPLSEPLERHWVVIELKLENGASVFARSESDLSGQEVYKCRKCVENEAEQWGNMILNFVDMVSLPAALRKEAEQPERAE